MYWQGSAEELDVTLRVDRVVQRTWPRWGDLSPTCRSRNRATSASCRPTLWVVTALAHTHTHTHSYTHMQTQTHIQHPHTHTYSHTHFQTQRAHIHMQTQTRILTSVASMCMHGHTHTHTHTLLWHTHYWTILESTLFDPDQLNHPAKWFKRWGL